MKQKNPSAATDGLPLSTELVPRLSAWFRQNARELPWRQNRDPYRVWISEIMLQQTRVETVTGYYTRFLAALPTVESLALASEDRLLKLWEGLGYYSRVRNLGKAAKLIMQKYGGRFPADLEALRKLPGIGDYTAGAIASIAFGLPLPAVDGNVLRVLSRLTADPTEVHDPALKKRFSAALKRVYPPPGEACGILTESLMELGATVCLPHGEPHCDICPLAEHCEAHRRGEETRYPVAEKRAARRTEAMTVLRLSCQGRLALRRRPERGVLAGLWELPHLSGTLTAEEVRQILTEKFALEITSLKPLAPSRHLFTHLEWRMSGFSITVAAPSRPFFWVTPEELAQSYSIPAAFAPFLP